MRRAAWVPAIDRVRAAFLVTILVLPSPARCQDAIADSPDRPFMVVTRSSVDENLFVLRMLADVYSQWPDLQGDRSRLRQWFEGARNAVATVRGKVHARHLDSDLEGLYSDCLEYMASTETYLDKLKLIEDQKNNQSLWDLASSIWGGYKVSNDVESTAKKYMTPEDAASAGNLVGTANAAADFYNRSQQTSQAAKDAVNAEAERLKDKWSSTAQALKETARRMTVKYGWATGEAGFDGFQSPQLADAIQRSPRDPFLQAKYGAEISQGAKSGNDMVAAINAYLTAARLVPADATYDDLRYQFLEEAMNAALQGAVIDSGGSYTRRPASSFNAIRLARTYLSVDTSDGSGIGHVQLARALAFAGRYQEALSSAQAAFNINQKWNTDPGYCIRYSKLMSFNNDQDQAVNWLERAYQFGLNDVKTIRDDPDFAQLKAQRPQEFEALTTVNTTWRVKFNALMDDVVIQNNSRFDLTHVKLQVHIRKGTQVWDRVAKCNYVQSGHSCEDDGLFSIPDNSYDEGSATISSDQE